MSRVNWDHLFAKTTRLFLQYHAWDVIYQHNNLVVLDWLHWSIIKLVQVTLSIPKMPLPWMKYKLFSNTLTKNCRFAWTSIYLAVLKVTFITNTKLHFNGLRLLWLLYQFIMFSTYTFADYQYIKFNLNSSSHIFTAWMLGESPWGKHNIGRSPPHWENERHFVLRHRMGCW